MKHSDFRVAIGRYDVLIRRLKGWMVVSIGAMLVAGTAFALVLPRLGAPFRRHVSFALALILAASVWGLVLTVLLAFLLSRARRALVRAADASNESEASSSPLT